MSLVLFPLTLTLSPPRGAREMFDCVLLTPTICPHAGARER
jgi:hypothetical protein